MLNLEESNPIMNEIIKEKALYWKQIQGFKKQKYFYNLLNLRRYRINATNSSCK